MRKILSISRQITLCSLTFLFKNIIECTNNSFMTPFTSYNTLLNANNF